MTVELDTTLEAALRTYANRVGETEEDFVRLAVQERLTRVTRLRGEALVARIRQITAPVVASALPHPRPTDAEVIGYNDDGLFD